MPKVFHNQFQVHGKHSGIPYGYQEPGIPKYNMVPWAFTSISDFSAIRPC